jgi:AcrR family transcriptional regulator
MKRKTRRKGGGGRGLDLLWGPRDLPRRGPKPGLSLDRIVSAAVTLAAEDGLDEVSMRRVAERLAFTTMSLYRYVRSKDELLDLMIEAVVGPPPVLQGESWRLRLEQWARGEWAVFQRHPWALRLVSTHPLMGPNRLGWLEAALGALAGTGLGDADLFEAVNLVDRYVRGTAQGLVATAARGSAVSHEVWKASHRALVDRIAHDARFPLLNRLWSTAMGSTPDLLEFGLQRVLDGLEVEIARQRSGPTRPGALPRRNNPERG